MHTNANSTILIAFYEKKKKKQFSFSASFQYDINQVVLKTIILFSWDVSSESVPVRAAVRAAVTMYSDQVLVGGQFY